MLQSVAAAGHGHDRQRGERDDRDVARGLEVHGVLRITLDQT
jgi:hypothetical protein